MLGIGFAILAVLAWLGLRPATMAAPAPGAAAVVMQRQAVMKGHATDLKAVKGYLEGTVNKAVAEEKATALARSIRNELPKLFPPGTGMAEVPASHAKPNIWSEPKRFSAALNTATEKTAALAAAVKTGDKTQIAAAFGEAGKACGGCHRDFKSRAD
ncbi:MAG TPA: cytochrome c [Stellaceae bacterium]|nr:cytochrome c [Stellaceae bacterium]